GQGGGVVLVKKAWPSWAGAPGLDRLMGRTAASGRRRASNGAPRLRLHSAGATNPLLGVRGGWLQGEQHRHCEGRGPFVAVHDGRSICSLMTLHSMSLKIKLFLAA